MTGVYLYQMAICVVIYVAGVMIGRASIRIDRHMKYTEPSDADFYTGDRK